MFLRLFGIIALICIICFAAEKLYEQEKIEKRKRIISAKHTAEEKFGEDCKKERERVRNELRQKYYSSSVTREVADYFLADKPSSPLLIRYEIVNDLVAYYADGTSIEYCLLEHGLPDIERSKRVDFPYEPPCEIKITEYFYDFNLTFHPQHEFCDALRQVISEQYGIDYAFGGLDPESSSTELNRVPTRQF